jgi:hypothetical protein
MPTLLRQISPVLLIVGVAAIVLALSRTLRQLQLARRAPYYILREEARRSAGRWAIASALSIALTAALVLYASQAPAASVNEPTPTATPPVPTLGPSPTRAPTFTPTPSPTSQASPTPPPTPTATLSPDLPDVLLTPIPGAVTPSAAARLEFLTLASRLDADSNPLDPGLQFPAGASRVYVFFRAAGVNNGATWGVFCFRDGEIFDQFVGLWEDGPARQTARAFCAHDGNPGAFRLRAYLGVTLAFEVQYTLNGDLSAPTQPPPTDTPAGSTTTP